MDYQLNTRLNGNIAMTSRFHENKPLQRDKTLYKFLWVQSGTLAIEVDHIPMKLAKDEIVTLTPLHHLTIKEVAGEFLTFVFNSNFYCIYGHDNEVSCNGFLFYGSSRVMRLKLSEEQSSNLHDIVRIFRQESAINDNLQEEMLRIVLKRFIITCTRIARARFGVGQENERTFDVVRRFYVLVDQYFREKKQVQDYADMLCRSPKTLSNLFSACGLPSPLRIIHERIDAEARRLLLYTRKSAKEISAILALRTWLHSAASSRSDGRECVGVSETSTSKNCQLLRNNCHSTTGRKSGIFAKTFHPSVSAVKPKTTKI